MWTGPFFSGPAPIHRHFPIQAENRPDFDRRQESAAYLKLARAIVFSLLLRTESPNPHHTTRLTLLLRQIFFVFYIDSLFTLEYS